MHDLFSVGTCNVLNYIVLLKSLIDPIKYI